MTGGIFTSLSAQISAEKAGMECVYEIPYVQFGEQCKIEFDSAPDNLKLFAKKVVWVILSTLTFYKNMRKWFILEENVRIVLYIYIENLHITILFLLFTLL